MTNTQMYLAVGVPFFSLLVVFLSNNRGLNMLGARIDDLGRRIDDLGRRMERMEVKVDSIGTDLREFYAVQRQHDTRLDAIERKQAS